MSHQVKAIKHLAYCPSRHTTGGETARHIAREQFKAPNKAWLGTEPEFASVLDAGAPLDAPCHFVAGHVVKGIGGMPTPSLAYRG